MTKTATAPATTAKKAGAAKTDSAQTVRKAALTAANDLTKSHSRETRDVPLAALYLHDFNPRKSVNEEEIEALALSIQILTLMQNLVGIEEDGPDGQTIGIVGGGRRLRALSALAVKHGIASDDYLVPVKLARDRTEALAWASAENTARVDLHPATEIDSYRRMIEGGATARTIAKAFAVSEKHVAGRLKLAGLAEPVLKALAADELTLEQAKAFTLAPDTETQAELLGEVLQHDADPRQIRSTLTHQSVQEGRGLGTIFTREDYEAAGGATRVDMFDDTAYYDDDAAVQKALAKTLKLIGCDMQDEGWKWVDVRTVRMGYDDLSDYGRLYPEQAEISEAEEAEYNDLADAIETGTATEDQSARFEALEAKLSEEAYTEDQRKFAGVVVGFDYRNELSVARGMVKKQDRPAAIEAGVLTKGYQDRQAEQGKEKKKPEGYSEAVKGDLASIRTAAVQQALLDDPALALDLLTYALTTRTCGAFPVEISAKEPSNRPGQDEGFSPDERIANSGPDSYLSEKAMPKDFAAFRAKAQKDRTAMLTEVVARSVRGSLAGSNAIFELIATETEASVRAVWTPTGPAFFKRLTRPDLVAIWSALHNRKDGEAVFGKHKKGAMVEYMHTLFTDPKVQAQLDEATQARIAAWLPKDMAVAKPRKPATRKKAAPAKGRAKKPAAKKATPAKA